MQRHKPRLFTDYSIIMVQNIFNKTVHNSYAKVTFEILCVAKMCYKKWTL